VYRRKNLEMGQPAVQPVVQPFIFLIRILRAFQPFGRLDLLGHFSWDGFGSTGRVLEPRIRDIVIHGPIGKFYQSSTGFSNVPLNICDY
jgi:hypothetical protein